MNSYIFHDEIVCYFGLFGIDELSLSQPMLTTDSAGLFTEVEKIRGGAGELTCTLLIPKWIITATGLLSPVPKTPPRLIQ